ncbi:hypothetical protein AB0L74_14255 [Streptomyces sp. NPDC052020]|uniref:hypothetical protein n=1 Tax=Streptomyces sp. NPDC052020 TaxID=3155677 RepID=UPI00343CA5A4
MRIGLISGDGLPVSGLLTVFRNVFELGKSLGVADDQVIADLGYTWRPDKPGFFPSGPVGPYTPDWLVVDDARPVTDAADWAGIGAELVLIRDTVARHDQLTPAEHRSLARRIATAAAPYRQGFTDWLERHRIDWVFALNMTLSDAVPVTVALHEAAAAYYADKPGGVLFWDHDLFESCAIHDETTGQRMYPSRPNRYTPVPRPSAHTRWAVVSEPLAAEAYSYPTGLTPYIAPNVLPRVTAAPLEERHHSFAGQYHLDPGRPVLLAPVRVFAVKGVDVSLTFLEALKAEALRRGRPVPYLLVFGSLAEDPPYARQVVAQAERLGVADDVRFLDGVPLASFASADGRHHLDETDLLRLARATSGGVVFTPSVADVETVGLGPALAAVAGLPVAVTDYEVFQKIYGDEFTSTRVDVSDEGFRAAASAFLDVLHGGPSAHAAALARNQAVVRQAFPEEPWIKLWRLLAEAAGHKPRGSRV